MSMLWQVRLKKHYQNELQSFDLDIQIQSAAKNLVLFGPSGAGKTQVLKMLAGLVKPESGFIKMGDETLFCLLYTSDAADD